MKRMLDEYERVLHLALVIVLLFELGAQKQGWFDSLLGDEGRQPWQEYVVHGLKYGLPLFFVAFVQGVYRRTWWRRRFPQWDLSGRWFGVSVYDVSILRRGESVPTDPPAPLLSIVDIEQELTSIQMSHGHVVFPTQLERTYWKSVAMAFQEGTYLIESSYKVSKEDDKHNPVDVYAVETIEISKSRHKKDRRPQMLRGTFRHAWDGLTVPLHRGETFFVRITDEELKTIRALISKAKRPYSEARAVVEGIKALENEDGALKFIECATKCLSTDKRSDPQSDVTH